MYKLKKMRFLFNSKVIFFLTMFIFEQLNAQNTICFDRPTINSLQKFPVQSSRQLLSNFGWTPYNNSENIIFSYFDVSLNYNSSCWYSSYSSGKNLFVLSQIGKPNVLIYQTDRNCYYSLLSKFSSGKSNPPFLDGNIMLTSFKINENTIEFREYKNDYSNKQYSVLLYNSLIFKKEIQSERNRIAQEINAERIQREREISLQKERDDLFESHIKKADSLFNARMFQDAKIEYQLANEIYPEQYINENISNCDSETYKELIAKADQKFNKEKYDDAINIYNEARRYSNDNNYIDNRIRIINQNILNEKIRKKIIEGDAKFKQNYYDEALAIFKEVLELDPNNTQSKEMVNTINRTKEILRKRSSEVFSYKETNKQEYEMIKGKFFNLIADRINASDRGFVNLKSKIGFDTLGNNRSEFISVNTHDKDLDSSFYKNSPFTSLTPSKYDKFYVASTETMNINSSWNSSIYKFNSKRKKQIYVSELSENENSQIRSFIFAQKSNYGKFKIKVKSKEINDDSNISLGSTSQQKYSDMSIVGYRTKAGPMSFLYSAILPGSGSLRVSYGKKGVGRMIWFLLNAGISYASKSYSDKQYNLYKSATIQSDIDNYYNKANISHQVSLATGGIAASIYVYDIFWTFSKGCKNLKQSKSLRKSSISNPIIIQTENIKLK